MAKKRHVMLQFELVQPMMYGIYKSSFRYCQDDHSPGKPGKVQELDSGQGKVRENGKSQGKL